MADLVRELEIPDGGSAPLQGRLQRAGAARRGEQHLRRGGVPRPARGRPAGRVGRERTLAGPGAEPFRRGLRQAEPARRASGTGTRSGRSGPTPARCVLRVLQGGEWTRYRLPRGSHSFDHTWNTEWMRIREVQTERYLMDAFGLFYELPSMVYGGRVWGVRPVASHLRIVPDFCYWRGLLVLAGDQADNASGQPQSGLWFGGCRRPVVLGQAGGLGRSSGGRRTVAAGEVSDPFLMTGFDRKVIHLANDGSAPVTVEIEVDPLGDGVFRPYRVDRRPGGRLRPPRVPRRVRRPLAPPARAPGGDPHRGDRLQLETGGGSRRPSLSYFLAWGRAPPGGHHGAPLARGDRGALCSRRGRQRIGRGRRRPGARGRREDDPRLDRVGPRQGPPAPRERPRPRRRPLHLPPRLEEHRRGLGRVREAVRLLDGPPVQGDPLRGPRPPDHAGPLGRRRLVLGHPRRLRGVGRQALLLARHPLDRGAREARRRLAHRADALLLRRRPAAAARAPEAERFVLQTGP